MNKEIEKLEMEDRAEWDAYLKECDYYADQESKKFVEKTGRAGFTLPCENALFEAIEEGNKKKMKEVCEQYHITLDTDNSYMLKHIVLDAPEQNKVSMVETAIQLGAKASDDYSTSYRIAVELGLEKVAQILLAHGAETDAIQKYGHTGIFAAENEDPEPIPTVADGQFFCPICSSCDGCTYAS